MTPRDQEQNSQSTQAAERRREARFRGMGRAIAFTLAAVNVVILVWLWLHDGGISGVHNGADVFTSLGRLTGLLGAYLLLLQVLLLARMRALDRLVGFDRLTVWHRINGKACVYLVLAHVGLITIGYTLTDKISIGSEINTLLAQYPGMIDATIGTGLLLVVIVSSAVIVRRRLRYETWYVVHLTAYAAVFLAWFHQLPTGNDFILNPGAAMYWTALYLVTLALVILFRIALPIIFAFRYQLKVAEVNVEGPNVVSLRLTGRRLDRMRARAGQFFLWRFLTPRLMWESHPFSLSAAPDGQSLRITVKSLGDFTSRMEKMKRGTRVLGVGPFGLFTDAVRKRPKIALIAGGVGITPIRALLEEMSGDVVLLYRVNREEEAVFGDELKELSEVRGVTVHYVVGHFRDPGAERLLSAEHLRELVPDIAQREVYVCGPPAMSDMAVLNVERAGVPKRYIHSEAFAFSPESSGARGRTRSRTRISIVALFAAVAAAILARFAWVATHSAPAGIQVAAAAPPTSAPTAAPTAAPTVQSTHTVRQPTVKATAVPKSTAAPSVTYAGVVESFQYGTVQVSITVKNRKIIGVGVAASPDSQRSQDIQSAAIPTLRSEVLQAQGANINTVSGATEVSNVFIQSLQTALAKAGL